MTNLRIHDITWAELMAADIERELAFYKAVLGVEAEKSPGGYYDLTTDGKSVGGAMQLTEEMGDMPPVWSTYVAVEDADATVEAVKAAGGMVLRDPFEIEVGGRTAVIADPTHGALCIFESPGDEIMGFQRFGETGAPCWFECMSTDLHATKSFLETVFGWTATPLPPEMGGDQMEYYMLSNGDDGTVCGLMGLPDHMAGAPTHWVNYYVVEDNDAACEIVKANGGTVVAEPWDTLFGRMSAIADPGGATLMLCQMPEEQP